MLKQGKSSNKALVKNTIMLYLLTFSSQLINIALIPYETRVLGPVSYGVIALGVSLSFIVAVVLDFGFVLSGTEKVVKSSEDVEALSHIVSNVALAKCFLAIVVGLFLAILVGFFAPFKDYPEVFICYYLAYVFNALLPDYLYRGMEYMQAITVRTICIRVLFSLPIFIFMKEPDDLVVIPMSLLVGNLVALVYSYLHIHRAFSISWQFPTVSKSFELMKNSLPFFVSRFASTFYQSMNTVILSYVYPGGSIVGKYGAADKVLSLAKSVSSPIADSLYPYMIRTKNYRLCRRILLLSIPLISLLSIIAFIWAEQLCIFIFGPGFEGTGTLLRCLIPAIAVIFPTYVICFPILVPLGLSKQANQSNVVGAVVQVALLAILLVAGQLTAVTLCIAASVSEVSVFLYRLVAAVRRNGDMGI